MNIEEYLSKCDIQNYYIENNSIHIFLHYKSDAKSIIKGLKTFNYKEILHFIQGRKIIMVLK